MVFNDGSDTYDEVRSLILKARTLRASHDIETDARFTLSGKGIEKMQTNSASCV